MTKVGVEICLGDRICRLTIETMEGEIVLYNGRYQDQRGAIPSRMHLKDSDIVDVKRPKILGENPTEYNKEDES